MIQRVVSCALLLGVLQGCGSGASTPSGSSAPPNTSSLVASEAGSTTNVTASPELDGSTLRPDLQTALDDAVSLVPSTGGRFQVVAVAIDVETGAVVAAHDDAGGELLTMRRPTGSALKFVVALAAVEAGLDGADLLDGSDSCFFPPVDRDPPVLIQGDRGAGDGTLRSAVARSSNCAFTRLYRSVGGSTVDALMRDLGLDHAVPSTQLLVQGDAQVSVIEMAAAFAPILNGGTYRSPSVGAVEVTPARVVDEETALRARHLLAAPLGSMGTAPMTLDDGWVAAGKTGTQTGNTDAWLVGGVNGIVLAVWMGNPIDPRDEMVLIPEYAPVAQVRGGTFPATVWRAFFDRVAVGEPPPLPAPAALQRDPVRILAPGVDCVAGQTASVTAPDDRVEPCR